MLALKGRLLPESSRNLTRGRLARRSSVAFEDRGTIPAAKTLSGRFTTGKHTFSAFEGDTSSTSAPFGTGRRAFFIREEVEAGIARKISAVSSGLIGGTIPLQSPAGAAHKNVYEVKDGIRPYM